MGESVACPEIVVSREGGILEISIRRPDRRNALTHPMYDAMTAALAEADADPGVRVALITGTEDCFTAGNDMVEFLQNPPKGNDSPVMRFLDQILMQEKPIVAAVNGPAVGIGTTLLLHCDLVYCARGARLQMPFVSLGLCPEAGASYLLPQIMGHPRAAQLLMLAETFTGEQAVEYGLANAVYDDGEYLQKAREACVRLAAQPPASVRMTKAFLRQPQRDAVAKQMRAEGDAFLARLGAPEAREAMTAFMEKRKPDFSRFE